MGEDLKYVEATYYLHDSSFLKKLLSAEEVSDLTGVPANRLVELADAECAPCVRIDGGPPKFYKKDILAWVHDHLVTIQSGKNISEPLVITVANRDPRPISVNTPEELFPIVDRLREFTTPIVPCVYFLVKDRQLVYIGQTVNLGGRLGEHYKTKEFDRCFYLPVPRGELAETEGAFIRALKPPLNCTNKGTPQNAAIVSDVAAVLERYGIRGDA